MNRTFAILMLLAFAVVATPAQAANLDSVCHLPIGCLPTPGRCGLVGVWLQPPDVIVYDHCLPLARSGEEHPADEEADRGCAALTVDTTGASPGMGCVVSWLEESQALAIAWAEETAAEAPV